MLLFHLICLVLAGACWLLHYCLAVSLLAKALLMLPVTGCHDPRPPWIDMAGSNRSAGDRLASCMLNVDTV